MKSSLKVLVSLLLLLSVTVVLAGPRRRLFKNPNKPPVVVPAISVADASCSEGHEGVRLMNFPVTLSSSTNFNVQVSFSVGELTANSGSDYTTTTGTISIPSGQTSSVISVAIVGDTIIEVDETLSVTLINPVHAVIGNSAAVGTIVNDDVPVVVGITHGTGVTTSNVGLAGKGVSLLNLTPAIGGIRGYASQLANSTDVATGWPRLYRLDITGQVIIDVPCVIEQCRVTNAGIVNGWYTIKNNNSLDFILRDCELNGPIGSDGTAVDAVVLFPRSMQRCIVWGGIDGMKISRFGGGCLIEESLIYGQFVIGTSHSDGVQITGGSVGELDTWVFSRCRIEGIYQGAADPMMLQAELTGNVSGVTIQDCFLSGGAYCIQTRQFDPYQFTKLKISGCLFAQGSAKYGPYATSVTPDVWLENYLASVVNTSVSVPVQVQSKVLLALPNLIPTTSK